MPLFSDSHGGSAHGLLMPETTWQEFTPTGGMTSYTPALNDIQIFLNMLYQQHADKCFALAGHDEVAPLFGGDITDGIKHVDPDTLTVSIFRQKVIALKILDVWLSHKNVKRLRMAEGTDAHELDGADWLT